MNVSVLRQSAPIYDKGIIYRFVTSSVLLPLQVFAVFVTLSEPRSEEEMARELERVVNRSCGVSLCV